MEIQLAKTAGFCYGVRRALQLTEESIHSGTRPLYSLGPLVHNQLVIERLQSDGVQIVDDLKMVENGCVVIRAHGVPPKTMEGFSEKGVQVVDATCPYVRRAQQWAKELAEDGYQVIIIGESEHAEVIGLKGWANDEAFVVETKLDVERLPYIEKAGVIVQTTQTTALVNEIMEALKDRTGSIKLMNTICSATLERQEEAMVLARQVNVMLVVGGRNSANTARLARISADEGTRTYLVQSADEIQSKWFDVSDKVGITAGASTPEWIIKGVMDKMEELKNDLEQNEDEEIREGSDTPNLEPSESNVGDDKRALPPEILDSTIDEEDNDVEIDYDQTFVTLQQGQIVKGTVVQVGQNEALVDVGGYKSEGVIPLQELVSIWMNEPDKMIKRGDVIDVYVVSVEDQEGRLILSKKRADDEKAVKSIEEAFNQGQLVHGTIKEVVKGGLLVDIGLQAFLPASQASDRYVDDLTHLVGESMNFKIIEVDIHKRRVVISRRKAIEEESASRLQETMAALGEGSVVHGIVRRLTDFGAFVDLGGIDGLLHVSEMSWGRIKHPSEVMHVGDELDVKVLSVNKENGRISLGLKQVLPNPWEVAAARYPIGSIVTGKVVRFTRFGAFVEIEPGIDGLLHISQISSKRVNKPEEVLEIGQTIEAKVVSQNPGERKIGLSIVEMEQDKAKDEYQRYIANQNDSGQRMTIGELLGNTNKED